ncbi:hypothetical protein AURDEDRAFT_131246 [Auricularia subglabra TFB-10046 SS5]|uniref:Uncharacterized protein n=1 Tax=Auricularia subglabra (strain TFB-10046 / SS5) TaxID=717982 RepID=J0LCP4_AURST|nr:hypothetical protein AURDEDRAFT_131246 [Auricularia subglabra TFB-10046 SS5]
MADVLRDAEAWQQARAGVAGVANTVASPAPQPTAPSRKRVRRGGKSTKPRKTWTPAQREAEKASAAYGARTALVRECRRLQRIEERSEAAPAHAAKFIREAENYSSSFKLSGLISTGSPFVSSRRAPVGRGGHTSQVRLAAVRDDRKLILLSFSQVFTDQDGVVYAVKPAQPSGDAWPQLMDYLFNLLRTLHSELKLSKPENINHARGIFERISWGTSHGGGRKRPTTITPDFERNKHLLIEFFKDPIVQRICRHVQSTFPPSANTPR